MRCVARMDTLTPVSGRLAAGSSPLLFDAGHGGFAPPPRSCVCLESSIAVLGCARVFVSLPMSDDFRVDTTSTSRSSTQASTSMFAVGLSILGFPSSLRTVAWPGSSIPTVGVTRLGSPMFAFDYTRLSALILSRNCACLDSTLPSVSVLRLDSPSLAFDSVNAGSSLSSRNCGRAGPVLSISGVQRLDLVVSVPDSAWAGSAPTARSML
jgi:hypothetical protein